MATRTLPMTPERLKANRENALKSTGPKTDEGKARSRLNGLRHGMRSELPIALPDEDHAALARRREAFAERFRPRDEVEAYLVEAAVAATWRVDRCRRAEAAALAEAAEQAADALDQADAEAFERLLPRFTEDPAAVVRQLRATSRGCLWLIGRWQRLEGQIQSRGFWELSERDEAVRLLGKRPDDVLRDPMVETLTLAAVAAGWGGDPRAAQSALLAGPTPRDVQGLEWERRGRELATRLPGELVAREFLAETARLRVEELRDRLEEAELHEARRRATAADRVAFDAGAEGMARHRYELGHWRTFRQALAELRALRAAEYLPALPAELPAERGAPTEPTEDVFERVKRILAPLLEAEAAPEAEPEPAAPAPAAEPPVTAEEPAPAPPERSAAPTEPTSAEVDLPELFRSVRERGGYAPLTAAGGDRGAVGLLVG